jgi:hypothetical protein
MTMRFAATALVLSLSAGPVLAEECPEFVPEDSVQRRVQAKKWFTKGEDSTKVNDDVSALKAYQCSLKFVPHGFTAFNIAQIAERVGDLELAVASYKKYLLLAPDAKDVDEINQKVDLLNQRLAKVKQQEKAAKAPQAHCAASGPAAAGDDPRRGGPASRRGHRDQRAFVHQLPHAGVGLLRRRRGLHPGRRDHERHVPGQDGHLQLEVQPAGSGRSGRGIGLQ